MLDSLEKLFNALQPIQGPGRSLLRQGLNVAVKANDDSAFARWASRAYANSPKSLAFAFANRPAFRSTGMESLRRFIRANDDSSISRRGLMETRDAYRRRLDDARRELFAALGKSLIAEGKTAEALDTLNVAARGSWNLELFHSLRSAYHAAGDSNAVVSMNARIAIDPQTEPDSATRIVAAGRAQQGAKWDSLTATARGEMRARLLERSEVIPLRMKPTFVDDAGKAHSLKRFAGAPLAIILWSRNCGAALERTGEIQQMFTRLSKEGKRVIFVVDEGPSAALRAELTKRGWTQPVFYDERGELTKALTAFGTPSFYVLDSAGRVRFDFAAEAAEVIAQMDAVASEGR